MVRPTAMLVLTMKPVFEPPRKGDVKHSLADISQARAKLGYSCTMDFDEGLARTVKALSNRG